jgi:cell division protein FtsB
MVTSVALSITVAENSAAALQRVNEELRARITILEAQVVT